MDARCALFYLEPSPLRVEHWLPQAMARAGVTDTWVQSMEQFRGYLDVADVQCGQWAGHFAEISVPELTDHRAVVVEFSDRQFIEAVDETGDDVVRQTFVKACEELQPLLALVSSRSDDQFEILVKAGETELADGTLTMDLLDEAGLLYLPSTRGEDIAAVATLYDGAHTAALTHGLLFVAEHGGGRWWV